RIKRKIKNQGIEARFIDGLIRSSRAVEGGKKYYSLWDSYVLADVVTYPSLLEGWGNQFIETVFAEKPIVLFEYPVFKADIKPEGYSFISLGDKTVFNRQTGLWEVGKNVLTKAAEELGEVLTDPGTGKKLRANFDLARKNNSYIVLRDLMERILEP
ncbi:MAG: glycosyltransferase family 4 protein, partial [Spirochaetes bacterium]|nr:glycosyltransferase family 4 protein [Spirochaetota bacterium]